MGIWAAPPCSSYSIARRPALRSTEYPLGLPTLNERDQLRVDAANWVTKCATLLLSLASRLGIPWVMENPQSSLIWKVPAVQQLSRRAHCEDTLLHQCQFGTPHKKNTILKSAGMVAMWKLERRCCPVLGLCSFSDQPHVHLSGKVHNVCRTAHAAAYPKGMAEQLAARFEDTALLNELAGKFKGLK